MPTAKPRCFPPVPESSRTARTVFARDVPMTLNVLHLLRLARSQSALRAAFAVLQPWPTELCAVLQGNAAMVNALRARRATARATAIRRKFASKMAPTCSRPRVRRPCPIVRARESACSATQRRSVRPPPTFAASPSARSIPALPRSLTTVRPVVLASTGSARKESAYNAVPALRGAAPTSSKSPNTAPDMANGWTKIAAVPRLRTAEPAHVRPPCVAMGLSKVAKSATTVSHRPPFARDAKAATTATWPCFPQAHGVSSAPLRSPRATGTPATRPGSCF